MDAVCANGLGLGRLSARILDAIGFSAQGGNTEAARQGLRWLYAATPVVVNLIVIAVMIRYPLRRTQHQEIVAQLEVQRPDGGIAAKTYAG